MIRLVTAAAALALGLTAAQHARAETFRLPTTGVPALAVDATAGWQATYDKFGNLQLAATDHGSAVELSVIDDPQVARLPAAEVAISVFRGLGAPPYNRSEADTIAGRAGMAFIGVLPSNGKLLKMRVVLVRLDATHFACLTVLKRRTLSAKQETALMQLVSQVSVVSAR
jgi:hypothetical protein